MFHFALFESISFVAEIMFHQVSIKKISSRWRLPYKDFLHTTDDSFSRCNVALWWWLLKLLNYKVCFLIYLFIFKVQLYIYIHNINISFKANDYISCRPMVPWQWIISDIVSILLNSYLTYFFLNRQTWLRQSKTNLIFQYL